MSVFGERIRKRRIELGMTLEELSQRIGMGRSNLGHIERGRNSTSIEVAQKIAEALHVSTDFLNGKTNDSRPLSEIQYMDFESQQTKFFTVGEALRYSHDFVKSTNKRVIREHISKIESDRSLASDEKKLLTDQLLGYKIPLIRSIIAGDKLLERENIDDWISYPLPDEDQPDYALRAMDNSMLNAGIEHGDIVFMRHAEWHDFDQQIVATIANNQELGTLRKIKQSPKSTKYLLIPENEGFEILELVPGRDFAICGIYMGHFKPCKK